LRGALVFLVAFVVLFLISLKAPTIPPGKQFYGLLGVPTTTYLVHGIAATTLISAVFNGVFYGVIVWLIYSIADWAVKHDKKERRASK
jgi:predicted secreted protein